MQKLRRVIDDSVHVLLKGREGLSYNLPHDEMIAMERQPLHTVMQNESPLAPDMLNVLLDVNTEQNLRKAVVLMDGYSRVPLQYAAQNRSTCSSLMLASLLLLERNVTPGNRDFAGRMALHTAVSNPSTEAGELTRRLIKANAGAARAEDGLGYLPIEIAFRSVSPVVGMVIACITTAFPDGALCEGGFGGNTMLHHGCSQEVLLSNKQAMKMVKALLAFHPETAHVANEQLRLPLHVVALTEVSQAIDIMQELIDRFPQGLMKADMDGNTPMHLAAKVNNLAGVQVLVEKSFRRPQHMQNKQGKFPMDLTRNRAVLKALTTPPTSMDLFYKREPLHVRVSVVLASLLLMTSNGILLSNYWNHHLRAQSNFEALWRGDLTIQDFHPRDLRIYFDTCSTAWSVNVSKNSCGIDSHLFYFIATICLYGSWILLLLFQIVVRTCMGKSIVKYYELGWFREHPKITRMLRDNSPLMFAKSLERFLILFPTALIHIVACQNHPDKYFPGDSECARVHVFIFSLDAAHAGCADHLYLWLMLLMLLWWTWSRHGAHG
jgi:ankyrin repeat protein